MTTQLQASTCGTALKGPKMWVPYDTVHQIPGYLEQYPEERHRLTGVSLWTQVGITTCLPAASVLREMYTRYRAVLKEDGSFCEPFDQWKRAMACHIEEELIASHKLSARGYPIK